MWVSCVRNWGIPQKGIKILFSSPLPYWCLHPRGLNVSQRALHSACMSGFWTLARFVPHSSPSTELLLKIWTTALHCSAWSEMILKRGLYSPIGSSCHTPTSFHFTRGVSITTRFLHGRATAIRFLFLPLYSICRSLPLGFRFFFFLIRCSRSPNNVQLTAGGQTWLAFHSYRVQPFTSPSPP